MLRVRLDICDSNGVHNAATITIGRGGAHDKLPHHFYYDYQARVDTGEYYTGVVLHNYDSRAVALVAKVARHIVRQQKAAKHKGV